MAKGYRGGSFGGGMSMGGGMRQSDLMKQAQKMQQDMLKMQEELEQKTYTADELVELTQIPARRVLSALTMLQVDGAVQEHPGRRFSSLVKLEDE